MRKIDVPPSTASTIRHGKATDVRPPRLSTALFVALMHPTPVAPMPAPQDGPVYEGVDADLPPVRRRAPYAVERFPAPHGFVQLVGYDGRGEFMTAVTIPGRRFRPACVERMRRWCMKNDEQAEPPRLSLMPD